MATLTVLMGPPGCGKTTWARERGAGRYVASTDRLRTDPTLRGSAATAAFLARLQGKVERALARRQDVIVDACNARAHERARWLRVARTHSARTELVVFHVPLSVLVDVQRMRTHGVSEDKMHVYQRAFDSALSVISNEQWACVTHVHRDNEHGNGIKHKSISNW